MKNKIILGILFLLAFTANAQKEKFQVNGAARGYFFANELDIDRSIDTVTTRNSNYGHTLVDLGFSVFPNDETEIISMFRIRNELGGFWGGGVSFNVRQLTLRGVAGGIVKYQLGDIDVKLTPYTLFNFQEEGIVNEADAFALRREIVHYDMFYNDQNKWRMQGANARFGLKFSNIIKSMEFNGLLTRQRPTDGILTPERLYGGGSITINQSDNLSVAFNSANMFDLTKTIQDSLQYKNNVHTTQINYTRDLNSNISYGVKSEGGMSSAKYVNYENEIAPENLNEWFYDVALTSEIKNKNIEISLGYKDVGADFLSPGAQTKRINYAKFPGLYQQFTNDFVGRPVSYFDVISGNSDNLFKLSETLIPYYAAYNNTTPYGVATPNRKGVYLEAIKTDSVKFKHSFLRVSALSQSRGEGTEQLKNFLVAEAGSDIYINDFFAWSKQIKIDLGVRYENTSRSGEVYEQVNLNSLLIDAGLSFEFANKLDFLLGAKLWTVKGNEYVNIRNTFNQIENIGAVNFDFIENTYAAGLRYRFSDQNTLSAQYQMLNIQHNNNNRVSYGINQFNILYSLFF